MTVTENQVHLAFTDYMTAYNVLAAKEDELQKMKDELLEYKEGGSKYVEAQQKIHEFEHGIVQFKRELVRAGLYIDRLQTLLKVEAIASKIP